MTLVEQDWRTASKCYDMDAKEADRIFFPSTGGKVGKARKFCEGGCLTQRTCLIEAIEFGLEGFWAGTTKKERQVMAKHYRVKFGGKEIIPKELLAAVGVEEIEESKDKPRTVRRRKRKRGRITKVVVRT